MIEDVRLVKEAVNAERQVGLIVMWREEQRNQDGAREAGDTADREREREISHVAEHSAEEREQDATDTVGEKHQRVVPADGAIAEFICSERRKQREVAAEIETDQRGTEIEQVLASSHGSEQQQDHALAACHEHDGVLASQPVAQRSPDDAADAVGDAEENRHRSTGDGAGLRYRVAGTLQRFHRVEFHEADRHQSRPSADREGEKDHVELGRPEDLLPGKLLAAGAGLLSRRPVTFRKPLFRWHHHPGAADQHQGCKGDTIDHECSGQPGRFDKPAPGTSQLDPAHRTKTETGHGNPGNHPLVFRKPAHADSNGHNITQADACPADQPDTKKHAPEIRPAGQASQQVATPQGKPRSHREDARAPFLQPVAGKDHDDCEAGKSDAENDLRLEFAPSRVMQCGRKYRPGIDGAETQLDEDGAENDPPAVESDW